MSPSFAPCEPAAWSYEELCATGIFCIAAGFFRHGDTANFASGIPLIVVEGTAGAGFPGAAFGRFLPGFPMALRGVPYSLTWSRVVEDGAQFHFITNSKSSVESVHRKFSPSAIASLRAPGQAAVRSGIWATDRELQLEILKKIRTERRALVFESGAASPGLRPTALQGGARAPRRLVDFVKAIPNISRAYFKSPFRRALYGGISLLLGFYVAQTISLSFGALGVNDVIAAALCVLFAEYITKYYHTRVKMTFTVALVNNFKMGFTYGLFIDAFKLAS